jgi:DNA-directed RNA polymerase specialized sigma24 family protein
MRREYSRDLRVLSGYRILRAVGLPVWVLMPQDRKQESFASRMPPHLQAAYNLARWMLRVPEDAEDAVQEAYMRALRSFGAASGNCDKAWLLAIVRNVCLTRLKRGASRGNVVMLDDVIDQIEMPSHAETDAPDHRLIERDRRSTSSPITAARLNIRASCI